jgi:hypothetical protein
MGENLMAGPWEKFQAPADGPWAKFGNSDASVAGVPGADPSALDGNRNAGKSAPSSDSWIGKLAGLAEPVLALGSGAIAAPIGAVAGMGKSLTSGKFGTQAGVREGEDFGGKVAEALTYQPRTQTGQNIAQKLGEVVQDSGIIGLPIGPELNAMTHLAAPAVRQAAASPAMKSTLSAARQAVEPEVFMAKSAAAKLGKAKVLPTIDQGTAQLADKAAQFGLTLTPDMLANNKIMRIAGEAAGKVPLSGAPNEANQIAFNRSLIRMIGGDESAKALTPDVYGDALHAAGEKIGDIAGKTHIPMDESFGSALASHLDDVAKFHTEDVANVVNNYVRELQGKAAANGGVVDGNAFRTLNSKIGRQIRGTTNGDLRSALGDLQSAMQDALQRNIASPEDMAALLDARKKYAIAKTIEPLVAKSPTGDISPAGLMGRVTSNSLGKTTMATGGVGELGDLARVGQRFLKEPGSSNTAERSLAYGILGGGAIASLPTTAGVFGAANLYNRLSPVLARRIVKNSLPDAVPPVSFPTELGFAQESPFGAKVMPPPAPPPYRGLLSLADEGDMASRAPTPATQHMATTHDWPTIDFPLRQEVLQQPAVSGRIAEASMEAARLKKIVDNAISPSVRAKAARDLEALQKKFGDEMWLYGISNPADAHGLNRPLYDGGNGTRLPIQKTFDPRRGLLDQ